MIALAFDVFEEPFKTGDTVLSGAGLLACNAADRAMYCHKKREQYGMGTAGIGSVGVHR